MSRKKSSHSTIVAGLLLDSHGRNRETRITPWPAIYALERFFGVSSQSQWKSVRDAVRHAAQSEHPSPMARYDFVGHAIHVFNGDALTRAVILNSLDLPK